MEKKMIYWLVGRQKPVGPSDDRQKERELVRELLAMTLKSPSAREWDLKLAGIRTNRPQALNSHGGRIISFNIGPLIIEPL